MDWRGWGSVGSVAAVLVVVGAVYTAARSGDERGPATRPNPAAITPAVTANGGVLHVVTREPAEHLFVDSTAPGGPARLLWFSGRGTAWTPEGIVSLDRAGNVVRFDDGLRAERLLFALGGRQLAALAWDGAEGFWVATREGSVLRLGPSGTIIDSIVSPFAFSHLASGELGRVWAVRSPEQLAYPFGQPVAPLIVPVGHGDSVPLPARLPEIPIFVHLVNAGRIAVGPDGAVYFAPFIRDEIVKFAPLGDTVWMASRGLPHGVTEPDFERHDGQWVLDYAPVNLGLAFGPDGMLYVLSTPGAARAESRLDVIDPDSGIVRRTARLPTALPTLAVNGHGRVFFLDEFRLLTGVAPAEREPLRSFDLERLSGGRLALEDFRGQVLLVNFWASWCAPCRVEMPALDSLRLAFATKDFAFVAISDDVEPEAAARFIEEHGFEFPVALGRGKMRAAYHYFGLPFTVLVDREGRVIERWSGFAGDRQIAAIGTLIEAELERGAPAHHEPEAPSPQHESHRH